MVTYPPEHRYEAQSFTAFQDSLPDNWLFRKETPDYGIDGSVELFTKVGDSTGFRFLVQIKSTAQKDKASALSVRLRRDTGAYYRQLPLPVLIVSYHVTHRTLFARWFHEFDPYPTKQLGETFTFRLRESDRVTAERFHTLEQDLKAFRKIEAGELRLPLPIFLDFSDTLPSLTEAKIRSSVHNCARRLTGLIEVVSDREAALATLQIAENATRATFRGRLTATLHTERKDISDPIFAPDALLLIARIMYEAGLVSQAALICAKIGASSSIINQPKVFFWASRCLAQACNVTAALELSTELWEREAFWFAAESVALGQLISGQALSRGERAFFIEYYEHRIKLARKYDNRQQEAVAHYNVGRLLGVEREYRKALKRFRMAAECDCGYWERDYFWEELGAICFDAGRFRMAAKLYRGCLEFGGDELVIGKYADSLFYAGRFQAAEEEFDRYLRKKTDVLVPQWHLKYWAAKNIRQNLGIKDQKRDRQAALSLADAGEAADPQDYEQAIRRDALCALAWFNLAVRLHDEAEYAQAWGCFLVAALAARWDVTAWVNAYLVALGVKQATDLIPLIAKAGYEAVGEEFVEQLLAQLERAGDEFPTEQVIRMTREIVDSYRKERPGRHIELRIVGGGAKYESVTLPLDRPFEW